MLTLGVAMALKKPVPKTFLSIDTIPMSKYPPLLD
jgi:hypothetical protein